MKKISLLMVACAAFAFTGMSQVRFGAQIGGNVGFVQFEDGSNDDISNKPRIGIIGGFLAEIPMGPVSFRPELNFIQKGFRNETSFDETETILGITTRQFGSQNTKYRMNYAEIPLNFVYNVENGGNSFFFGLGPNFALGLSGKREFEFNETSTFTVNGATTSNTSSGKGKADIKFSGEQDTSNILYLKRFDFGGNLILGFRSAMGITVSLGGTLGLSDISRNINTSVVNNDNRTWKNHGIQLKVGYMFGGNSASKKTTTSSPASSTDMIF